MRELSLRIPSAPANLPLPTLGGKQLWTDRRVVQGWRVQANLLTGHARLLDRHDIRRAWGSEEHCLACLERLARQADRGTRSHLVVLVHGLGRSKDSLRRLVHAIDNAGFDAIAVNYPSLFRGVDDHADRLEQVLSAVQGYRTASFVTHSLGALVVRHLLSRPGRWRNGLRVHGVAMIAPPNRGSRLAERLSRHRLFRLIAGASALDARASKTTQVPRLEVPYRIIAGTTRAGSGCNPMLEGDDDGIIRVEETRLSPGDEILTVASCHTLISNNTKTIAAVVTFLASDPTSRMNSSRHAETERNGQ